ncbi:RsiV family protein [Nocardia sp. NPDC127526]|uniref:RsiV family protein n=1 Tax=Nocardia sp. NPDC127526 TaxID=3345393 RepID=UPI0036417F56
MRITSATVVAIAALAVTLTACGDATTPGAPGGPSATTSVAGIPPRNTPLSASGLRIDGAQGTLAYDVLVPQVQGGTGTGPKAFNQGMRALLQSLIDEYDDGGVSLTDPTELSAVEHIGGKVISGVLWTSLDGGGVRPITIMGTHVTNLETGLEIELPELFTDQQAGLDALSAQAALLLPQSRTGADFDADGITPTLENFRCWTATPEGMHVHFVPGQVGPNAMGVVDLTIPWTALSTVLDPAWSGVIDS